MVVQTIQHLTVDQINECIIFFLIGKSHENAWVSKDFLVNFVSLWFIFLKKKIALVKLRKQKSNKTNKQKSTTAQGSWLPRSDDMQRWCQKFCSNSVKIRVLILSASESHVFCGWKQTISFSLQFKQYS